MIAIENHLGVSVPVFAALAPAGMIDLIVRADTYQEWYDAALSAEMVTGYDDETGALLLSSGVSIDLIGVVEVTPAVMDVDGETVLAPAVMDDRFHANIRLSGTALTNTFGNSGVKKWETYALAWMQGDDAAPVKSEAGKILSNATLIDPDTIQTKSRVWA
jgi:hypothetical protein